VPASTIGSVMTAILPHTTFRVQISEFRFRISDFGFQMGERVPSVKLTVSVASDPI
jgi:hypothetical protein